MLSEEEKTEHCKIVICEIIAEKGRLTVRELFEELEERGIVYDYPDYLIFNPDDIIEPGPNWDKSPRIN